MAYTMLDRQPPEKDPEDHSLKAMTTAFLRDRCEGLRFENNPPRKGKSRRPDQIPFNMEMDIDRLCLENAVVRFLGTGRKEDAFDVYFCYLDMFLGNYRKTGKMIELLSEFEQNASSLLQKHRDHFSHSVYVFCLGLAIYESSEAFRRDYREFYPDLDEQKAAFHFLEHWGLTSLFHDIGYPFELPFEQICSYFESMEDNKKNVKDARKKSPFLAYQKQEALSRIDECVRKKIANVISDTAKKTISVEDPDLSTTDSLFAYELARLFYGKSGVIFNEEANDKQRNYQLDKDAIRQSLQHRPSHPEKSNFYMDHAYFSALILFQVLFKDLDCDITQPRLDALTAILMHNSFYKWSLSKIDQDQKQFHISLHPRLHPLAYMLMLCDELQCWDRIAYGRNTRGELHPMDCTFDFSDGKIQAFYQFDEMESPKIDRYKDNCLAWYQKGASPDNNEKPTLKAYSEIYAPDGGEPTFLRKLREIVDLSERGLVIKSVLTPNTHTGSGRYLSNSSYVSLYHFAVALHGRYHFGQWKAKKRLGQEVEYLSSSETKDAFEEAFQSLSLEYKLSNINQAKSFGRYLDAIGCFYTDKQVDYEMITHFTLAELDRIGRMEHQRWLQEHYDMGWIYGEPSDTTQREKFRLHKDMLKDGEAFHCVTAEEASLNYDRLNEEEQAKDTEPMECMLALLKMYDGLRIYRLK